ncbi:MAG: leucine-rich repeat domain-containing protein [Clostridia bacterium]|nr:leucine-rich repeat domain-containing protein [Clostridia bacterium]
MGKNDDLYFDYQLMNETFRAIGEKDVYTILSDRFNDISFETVDTRGKNVPFVKLITMFADDKLYSLILPLIDIQGLRKREPVVVEVDGTESPSTMHVVKDKKITDEVMEAFEQALDNQEYKMNNFRAWLADMDNHEPVPIFVKPKTSVKFKKLAAECIGGELYVVLEPMDHLELFKNNAKFVYFCNDKIMPPSLQVPTQKMQNLVMDKYLNEKVLESRKNRLIGQGGKQIVYDDFFEETTFIPADGENIYDLLLTDLDGLKKPLVLRDEAGRKITFRIEAVAPCHLYLYVVLNPITEIKGCDKDTEILFQVNDYDYFSPVLQVETNKAIYDEILDDVYDMFDDDEEILLNYPPSEEILLNGLEDEFPVFYKNNDDEYCRFVVLYNTEDHPKKLYAVLAALSSTRTFEEDEEYVFCMKKLGRNNFGDLNLETDDKSINEFMDEYNAVFDEEEDSANENGDYGDESEKFAVGRLDFLCPKCFTEYSGDVCPKCGATRRNLGSVDYPACIYLDRYSASICREYMSFELEKFSYRYFSYYTRCGVEPQTETPCVLNFRLSGDGYVVAGIGGCKADKIGIPSVYNGKPVIGIEKSAFAKSRICSVHVPDSVKFIGALAFEGCQSLNQFESDATVDKIEEGMFMNCKSLRNSDLPEGIKTIGRNAFFGCSAINSIQIPESMTTIEDGAFDGCEKLETVYYNGKEDEWCKIRIDEKGNATLFRADVLYFSKEKPTRPGSFWHFMDEKSSCRIKWRAYRDPATDYSAFVSNDYLPSYGLKYEKTIGGYMVVGREECEDKNIVIPSYYKGERVVAVSNCAFEKDDILKNVVISKGVNKIGAGAFNYCSDLKNVIILSDISEIEDWTFGNSFSLASVVIPDTCKKIGEHAFSDCDDAVIYFTGDAEKWKEIDIEPESNECLFYDSNLFFYSEERPSPIKGHWHFTEKFKPSKWTGAQKGPAASGKQSEVGVIKYPFNPAVNLPREEVIFGTAEEENLPHGLEYQRLGKYCAVAGLGSCTDLKKNLILPTMYNGLYIAAIGPAVFKGRTDITSVEIPDNVTSVDDEAFEGCTGLVSADIPDSVERIGKFAFSSCALESVDLPENMWHYFGVSAFESCRKLKSVVFGERMFDIPKYAFRRCTALEYVIFPHYFRKLSPCAFETCRSLRAVFYPSTEKEWKREYKYAELAQKGNEDFWNATMYFYSEERPERPGNFWHYDDERNPVIWDK